MLRLTKIISLLLTIAVLTFAVHNYHAVKLKYVGDLHIEPALKGHEYDTYMWCKYSESCAEVLDDIRSWLNDTSGHKYVISNNSVNFGNDIYYLGIGCSIDYVVYVQAGTLLSNVLGFKSKNHVIFQHTTALADRHAITIYKGDVVVDRPE
jgi:hypothetical protein